MTGRQAGVTPLDIVILAAGKGTRMKSAAPKVLQKLAGRPLLGHVLDSALQLRPRSIVVVTGHGAEQVRTFSSTWLGDEGGRIRFAHQEPQLGTGDAVRRGMQEIAADDGRVLVLSGDVPLTEVETLRALVSAAGGDRVALLTVQLPDPTGYGRVVREGGGVRRIVEQKDASTEERAITEVYSGILVAPARRLHAWLAGLSNDNAQREYYLTDVVGMAVTDGVEVVAHQIADATQVAGVNSPAQLAALERTHQRRQADALLAQGVRLADPARFDVRDDAVLGVRAELLCARDVEIDVGCIFAGRVRLGEGVHVGAYCSIANAEIEADARIRPYTHMDGEAKGVRVGEHAQVGPFARLRPGADLGPEVHVGDFVEIKNSTLARGAKANHLAYLGDATVGEGVNYGAGSITANYDGVHKHRTVIGAGAHIGSNCVLVAPVTVGAGGTVGAGSVVTEDTPPNALAIARGRQVNVTDWHDPAKD